MHADGAAVPAGSQQRLENARIVEHEDAGVGHEQLERRHALADERVHLGFHLIGQLGDDHVEAVVDDRLAFRLLRPRFQRVMQRLAAILDGEIDDRGGAAEGRRDRAALEVVGRRRPAERHVQMRVDVDAAGQDVLVRRVDDRVGVDIERRADDGNLLVLDEHVAPVLIRGGDDRAVLDQRAHDG